MKYNVATLLTLGLLGCSNSDDANSRFRDRIAEGFTQDCKRSAAPTPELKKQLNQLCSCTADGIRSSDIVFGDSESVINDKVQKAAGVCLRAENGEEQSE